MREGYKMTEEQKSLIKRAIGICECMKAAREARVGVRIMRMYAAESNRIASEFHKYFCKRFRAWRSCRT